MNKIIAFLLAAFSLIMLQSCKTSQKVTVEGIPGTEIYSPRMEKLGVIEQNRKTTFKISSNDYFSYLMSKNAGSDELVPFALDYKNHNYTGSAALEWVGASIAAAGVVAMIPGVIMLCGDDDGSIMAIGGVAALLGTAIGMPASMRNNQVQYKHRYKYLSVQNTNQDMHFTKIVDTGYNKNAQNNENREATSSTTTAKRKVAGNSTSATTTAKRKVTTSKRTLNDYAKYVSATYVGKGTLYQKGQVIEKYDAIKVVVTRIDNNTVNVEVFESGESYFNAKTTYQIKKKGKNTYTLTLDGVSDACITIDNAGNLTYIHPKVNIDGEIYTLNISAGKK